MQKQCQYCWWLSDERTGLCCNEESEYNLCNVNMDNSCPLFSDRWGREDEERKEWQEGDYDRE